MLRCLLAGLLMAVVIAAAGLPGSEAQEKKKKAQPKKERIAIADPKEAAKDPNFAVQGEYIGNEPGSKSGFGAQVVAVE